MKKFVAVMLMLVMVACCEAAAQQYAPNGCGSRQVNYIKNVIVEAETPTDLQFVLDSYWSPTDGAQCDSWGRRWLSEYAVFALGIKAKEMWNELSIPQRRAVKAIITDAVDERNFYLGKNCGTVKGNSCSEDYASMVMVIAMVKNMYPRVAQKIGFADLTYLEKLYVEYTFSTYNGYYSLIEEDGWIKMYNHGGESPVYALYLLTDMGNAMYTYQWAGNPAPEFYNHPNVYALFVWAQSHAEADGSAFKDDCLRVNGEVIPCNDPGTSDTNPYMIPGGRFIGFQAKETGFPFMKYDETDVSQEGNHDIARRHFYDLWNPMPYPLGK